jgi:hypothetical protein
MKRLSSKFSVLVTVAVMASATFAGIQADSSLSHLTDYRRWTKMNSEPVKVETQVSAEAVSGMSTPV